MARITCIVCFISTINGRSNNNKKRKGKKKLNPWKASASSRHITNLKQSILETFNIYAPSLLSLATLSAGEIEMILNA
jgi:hypothetical protein